LISVPAGNAGFANAAAVSASMIAGDQPSAQAADTAIAQALATPGIVPRRLVAEPSSNSVETTVANRLSIKPVPQLVAAAADAQSAIARRLASQIALLDVALEDSWLDLLAHHRIKTAGVRVSSTRG
jgi:hypothetical protein